MLAAFPLALGDLGNRRILGVLAISLAITLAAFAGTGAALYEAIMMQHGCLDLAGFEICLGNRLLAGAGSTLATLALMWLLFPAIAIAVVSLFADRIVQTVEARHYPQALARARTPGWGEAIRLGLASGLRLLAYNLLATPFYLILLVTGVGTIALFVAVNALALGRDLGEMVAVRHLPRAARREWLAATRVPRLVLGVVATGLFMVPVANLLAPVLGAAMATHMFHRRR